MHLLIKAALLGSVLVVSAFSAEPDALRHWEATALNIESGLLWEVGDGTPIAYRLVPTQLSWRSKAFLAHVFADGSRVVARHRLTLIGTLIQYGPESHYMGVAGSPSIEWWNKTAAWSLFTGAGGGFGLIDSRGIAGGQGQDFTLNWFVRCGIEHYSDKNKCWTAGVMFQHMSNGGRTEPNPGIDALGFTVGYSWLF